VHFSFKKFKSLKLLPPDVIFNMTSGGSNFNDFPENQLTKILAVGTVLRQIGTTRSFVHSKIFHYCEY